MRALSPAPCPSAAPCWAPSEAGPFPADVDVPQPDEKSIITYVSSLYDAMPRVPDVQDGVKANVSGGRRAGPGRWGCWGSWGGGPGRGPAASHGPAPQQELQLRWLEYRELVLLLLQWVRHHTAAFEERRFPASFEEIEVGLASRPPPRPRAAPRGPGRQLNTRFSADFVVPVPEV